MKYILTNIENRIGTITLNRPEKRNALNFPMVTELREAFTDMAADPDVKVIVLKANGKAFCAGADLEYIKQLQSNSYEENLDDSEHLMELFYTIYTIPKVVISQVHGYAIAGGCGLATVCDFTFAGRDAEFGYSEVKIGFVPAIVMTFLLRRVGELRAKELLLSGNRLTAEEATGIHLINEVTDNELLEKRVDEFSKMLVSTNSGQSMGLTKQMIAGIQSKDLRQALDYAAEKNARARGFEDCEKGIAAFLEREKLMW